MDLGLHGKVCIVTGASKGIGRAIASVLAAEVARAVAFLLSPAAGYLQGAIVDVDGGATRTL